MHESRVFQEPSHCPLAQSDQFEIKPTRSDAITEWIKDGDLGSDDRLFPSRVHDSLHMGTINHTRMLDFGLEKLDSIHRLMAPTQRAVP
jgi:hypothetical protein